MMCWISAKLRYCVSFVGGLQFFSQAGLLIIEKIEFDLVSSVESVLEVLYPMAFAKGVELHSFVEPDCPATLVGDSNRIRQVIFPLCNSI
jgi:signal transduction histidine kinase